MSEAGEAFMIIDIRSEDKYNHNHVPGAINVPYGERFDEYAKDEIKDADTRIILTSDGHSCQDYPASFEQLAALGYTNVSCHEGGIFSWLEKGYPLAFGRES